jgi:hypothetical protein
MGRPKKYFTEEERKSAIKKDAERHRRKIGQLPKKHCTEEERKETKKRSREKYREVFKENFPNYNKEYYQKHRVKILKSSEEYRQTHQKEIIEYRQNHKEEARIYEHEKLAKDIDFKLRKILRNRLRSAIKNNAKRGSAVKDLGCSVPELKIYLESKFQEGMSWDNWTWNGWHVDHIIPLNSFDLSNREEFLKACHYTNLQPL